MLHHSHDSFSCFAFQWKACMSYQWLHQTAKQYYSPFEKSPDLREGGGGVHLIPESMFLVFNTVRMYQRCSEAQGSCQTNLSVSYLGKRNLAKSEAFSHSVIEQAVLAGIKWINVKSKPFDKTVWEESNSSVSIMNQVQPEIFLAVQLGALHATSYWTLQYGEEETHHTFAVFQRFNSVCCKV